MNNQIKKDRELLEEFLTNEMFQVKRFQHEGAIATNSTVKSYVESLLDAQVRVTQYEEKQRVAKLVTGFITDRMGDIQFTDLQELERLILTDND